MIFEIKGFEILIYMICNQELVNLFFHIQQSLNY